MHLSLNGVCELTVCMIQPDKCLTFYTLTYNTVQLSWSVQHLYINSEVRRSVLIVFFY